MPYKYPKSIGINEELYNKMRFLMNNFGIDKFNVLLEGMVDTIMEQEKIIYVPTS